MLTSLQMGFDLSPQGMAGLFATLVVVALGAFLLLRLGLTLIFRLNRRRR